MNIRKFLNQDVVYWPPVGKTVYGEPSYGPPEERKARVVVEYRPAGNARTEAVIRSFSVLFADPVEPLGAVRLGSIGDLAPLDQSPANNSGAVIREVLPFVDRKGVTLGYQVTTDPPVTFKV